MRANYVERCNKSPGDCGKCGKTIKKGSPYRWAKGRYTSKKVRCGEVACVFRPSDLTGSDKLGRVYGAQEAAEDALGTWTPEDGVEGLQSLCDDMANELREVAQEYRDAAEAMGGAGAEMEEKADNLESWADTVESASGDVDEFTPEKADAKDEKKPAEGEAKPAEGVEESDEDDTEDERDANGQTREEWGEDARGTISDAIGDCPL
jgi:hypothetical protein